MSKMTAQERANELLKTAENISEFHLYEFTNVLRPRGTMQKESLGAYMLHRLLSVHDSWTNPKYADNPDESTLVETLKRNLQEEVDEAFAEFLRQTVHKKGDE